MVLHQINENKAWIQMNWKCAFIMQWSHILFVIDSIAGGFQNPEALAGDKGAGSQKINPKDNPEERSMLVFRGYSNLFRGNISITFYTNTNDVTIYIPKSLGLPVNYESLAIAIGPFMDSMELRMYAAG